MTRDFQEVEITDHAEWHDGQSGFPNVDEYFRSIDRCRLIYEPLGLKIYSGLELGNPHQHQRAVADLLQTLHFDLVLGSLHWLYGENIHLESCFANKDPNKVYIDYFTELGIMAESSLVDMIAHFDRILWRGSLLGIPFDPRELETVIRYMN